MTSVFGMNPTTALKISVGFALVFSAGGCGRSDTEAERAVPRNPREAASQMEQAFVQAPPEIKQVSVAASDAMQKGDYEKAVVSLHVLQGGKGITLEQGLAIHNSMVALEAGSSARWSPVSRMQSARTSCSRS